MEHPHVLEACTKELQAHAVDVLQPASLRGLVVGVGVQKVAIDLQKPEGGGEASALPICSRPPEQAASTGKEARRLTSF